MAAPAAQAPTVRLQDYQVNSANLTRFDAHLRSERFARLRDVVAKIQTEPVIPLINNLDLAFRPAEHRSGPIFTSVDIKKVKVLATATYFNYRLSEWKNKAYYRLIIAFAVSVVATPILTVFDMGMVGTQCIRNRKLAPLVALVFEIAGVILFPIVQLIPKEIITRYTFTWINNMAANSEDTNQAKVFKSFVITNQFMLAPVSVFNKKIV